MPTRIGELRKVIAMYNTAVIEHYTDGPHSVYWGMRDPNKENRVLYTMDLSTKVTGQTKSKLLTHLNVFYPKVQRAYFTKSERLKVIFNGRVPRGKKI